MDKETVRVRRHSEATKRQVCQYLVASMTPEWPTGNATYASQEMARRGISVPPDTIDYWRRQDKFRALFAEVRAEHFRVIEDETMKATGEPVHLQIAKHKARLLDRISAEMDDIPIDKLADVYEKLDRVQRLEQGKPTEIQERQLAELRELEEKSLEELREMVSQRLADIPTAEQSVENPHALEKKVN